MFACASVWSLQEMWFVGKVGDGEGGSGRRQSFTLASFNGTGEWRERVRDWESERVAERDREKRGKEWMKEEGMGRRGPDVKVRRQRAKRQQKAGRGFIS